MCQEWADAAGMNEAPPAPAPDAGGGAAFAEAVDALVIEVDEWVTHRSGGNSDPRAVAAKSGMVAARAALLAAFTTAAQPARAVPEPDRLVLTDAINARDAARDEYLYRDRQSKEHGHVAGVKEDAWAARDALIEADVALMRLIYGDAPADASEAVRDE